MNEVDKEIYVECNIGILKASQPTKISHTFVLSTKYCKPMNLKFMDKGNSMINNYVEIGCHGIGVSKIIEPLAEMLKDESGLNWPIALASYLVSVGGVENNYSSLISKITEKLSLSTILKDDVCHFFFFFFGIDTSFDTQINLLHSLEIPLVVIVGPKYWLIIEIGIRGKPTILEVPKWKEIYNQKKEEYDWKVIGPSNDMHLEKHIVS